MTAPVLYRPTDVVRLTEDLPVIQRVSRWMTEFLARPHPDLGRTGSVCPFVPKAMAADRVSFVVVRTQNRVAADIDAVIGRLRDEFLGMAPTTMPEAMDKAIMVILPDISEQDAPAMIDETHARLKASFVEAGLMIGKFHPRSDQAGLHNIGFRPLRSPVPLLAIRYMVDSDLPFLNRPDDPAASRITFLEAYERRFEGDVESPWSRRGQAALSKIRASGENER